MSKYNLHRLIPDLIALGLYPKKAPPTGSGWQLQAPIAAAGTAINIPGVPIDVNEVEIGFVNMKTNGSSPWQMRMVTSGGPEITTYIGAQVRLPAGSVDPDPISTGFQISSVAAVNIWHGKMNFKRLEGNLWAGVYSISRPDGELMIHGAGTKLLSGDLTGFLLTTDGAVNIFTTGFLYPSWRV